MRRCVRVYARLVILCSSHKDQTTMLLKLTPTLLEHWLLEHFIKPPFHCPCEDSGAPMELPSGNKASTKISTGHLNVLIKIVHRILWEDPGGCCPGDLFVDLRNTGGWDDQCQCINEMLLNARLNLMKLPVVLNFRGSSSSVNWTGKQFSLPDEDFSHSQDRNSSPAGR